MSGIRRLCVIGNSHVACLKLAQTRGGAGEMLPPTDYFAASANRTSKIRVTGAGHLAVGRGRARQQMAAISGGRERINVHDYDAFAFVGIGFEFRDFLRVFRTHCLHRHQRWQAGRGLLSDGAFTAFLRSFYAWRPAYRLAGEIAALRPEARLAIVAAPFPVRAALEEAAYAALRPLGDTGYFAELARLHADCAAAAARSVGALFVPQAAETLAAPGFTAERFNTGSVGLQTPGVAGVGNWYAEKRASDVWHMNPDFGRGRLADLHAALAA
jgi:hypothetical protein